MTHFWPDHTALIAELRRRQHDGATDGIFSRAADALEVERKVRAQEYAIAKQLRVQQSAEIDRLTAALAVAREEERERIAQYVGNYADGEYWQRKILAAAIRALPAAKPAKAKERAEALSRLAELDAPLIMDIPTTEPAKTEGEAIRECIEVVQAMEDRADTTSDIRAFSDVIANLRTLLLTTEPAKAEEPIHD